MGTTPQAQGAPSHPVSLRGLAIFSFVALFPTPLPAQAAEPENQPPSARQIIQRSLQFETLFALFDFGPPPGYICLVDIASRTLDGSGDPAHSFRTWEVMRLYSETFQRLIRKNGEELSPTKARIEEASFDRAFEKRAHETPEAQAKRQRAARKFQAERDACRDEFTRVFNFRLSGQEVLGGRPTWVIDASPVSNSTPRCGDLKTLSKFHFKLWIDQAEFGWARVEGDNVAPTAGFVSPWREPAGGLHLTSEQTRNREGVWLRTKDQYKMNRKTPIEITTTYSGYRKFQADSHILTADGK